MNVVRRWKICILNSLHIRILVVVKTRAVIEDQGYMRLVVAKDVIAKDLAVRKVIRQNQCLPGCRHHVTLFESASGKNSETSCLESRRIL